MTTSTPRADGVEEFGPLLGNLVDDKSQVIHLFHSVRHLRRASILRLPALDFLLCPFVLAFLRVESGAEAAILFLVMLVVKHLHPARFTDTVFLLTMLTEVPKLPVSTLKGVIIVEAHVSGWFELTHMRQPSVGCVSKWMKTYLVGVGPFPLSKLAWQTDTIRC